MDCSPCSGMASALLSVLSRFDREFRWDDLLALGPVFLSEESRVGIGRGLGMSIVLCLSRVGELLCVDCSSVMGVSPRNGSGRDDEAPRPLAAPPTAPTLARFFSNSFSRRRSLELMYMSPFWLRPCFLPQLSWDACRFNSKLGATPRSTDRLPMLWASSRDPRDPLDDGRDEVRRIDLKPPLVSRTGDLGAVRGEKPDGGFAVRITGGLAASSSREMPCSNVSSADGWEKAP